jgi:uncharacterized membrane-anchored protein
MSRKALIFAAAVAAQVLILIALPLSKAYTRATGRTVILKVAPVDPYNILSGYYVTLGYDISRAESFPDAAGAQTPADGAEVFAVVEEQAGGSWRPVRLTAVQPSGLPPNQAFIRGRRGRWRIEYGIEQFFIPEEKRGVIEEDLRKNLNEARVEVKVDAQGNAALVRLLIEDRIYE